MGQSAAGARTRPANPARATSAAKYGKACVSMNETAADMNREPKGPTTRTRRRARPKLSQPYVFSTIEIVAHIPDDEPRERSVVGFGVSSRPRSALMRPNMRSTSS